MAYTLRPCGLPRQVTREMLREKLIPFGPILFMHFYDDFEGSEAVVIFASRESADAAQQACSTDDATSLLYFAEIEAARQLRREEAARAGRCIAFCQITANACPLLECEGMTYRSGTGADPHSTY